MVRKSLAYAINSEIVSTKTGFDSEVYTLRDNRNSTKHVCKCKDDDVNEDKSARRRFSYALSNETHSDQGRAVSRAINTKRSQTF